LILLSPTPPHSIRLPHCSRNVMDSARSAPNFYAPAMFHHAFTMRMTMLPKEVTPMKNLDLVNAVTTIPSPCPSDKSLSPHHLIAVACTQHLQVSFPRQYLRLLTLCRSSVPWTSAIWVTCQSFLRVISSFSSSPCPQAALWPFPIRYV